MRRTKQLILSSSFLIFLITLTHPSMSIAQSQNGVLGTWLSPDKSVKMLIYKGRRNTKTKQYGENPSQVYGRIIWSKNGGNIGKKLLVGFSLVGSGYLRDGKALHLKNGKIYTSYVRLNSDNTLRIRKYIKKTIIGDTETWTLAKGE